MNLRRVVWTSALLLFLASGAALAAHTERVSVSSTGEQGDAVSRAQWESVHTISADGRFVVFESGASNLVPEDSSLFQDVFVRDRWLGTTELASVSTTSEQANHQSRVPAISADGRFVSFSSPASNLVSGDTNDEDDIFLRDRLLGTAERVSVSNEGDEAEHLSTSLYSAISADGRLVAFDTNTDNFVPGGETGLDTDVFVRDRFAGTTEFISVNRLGGSSIGSSHQPSISADGRFVAFHSDSGNLVSGDGNGTWDVFVRDRLLAVTERVSVSSTGAQGNDGSGGAAISADGRYVAFDSIATNLVPDDTNECIDVFVHDRVLGTTERVSVSSLGQQGSLDSQFPSISAHGRFVAFVSSAFNLVPGDTNNLPDIFVRDRLLGTTERVSVSTAGEEANAASGPASISANGGCVAFYSEASNLVADDTNGVSDAFVRVLDAHEATFVDVPATHWAYAEIEACADAGIVSGYDDGWYHPDYPVSRAQMAVFISRSICTPTGEAGLVDYISPSTPTFPDVFTDYWAYKYIEYAAEHNIVGGYPTGLYHPNELVNRGQMAVFVARAMVTPSGDAAVLPGPPSPTFPDVTATNAWSWCYDHVEHIAAHGVTQGYFDGYYHPEYTCTRDMMAVYIQRAFDLPM